MNRIVGVTALCAAIAAPAMAGEHTITVTKTGPYAKMINVRYVKVIGATPEAISVPGQEDVTFTVDVTMPSGLCQTRVSVIVGGKWGRTDTYMNVCSNGSLNFFAR